MNSFNRYDIHWAELDPTKGSEIQKTRPCIIISPNELNEALNTVMVVPLTSTIIDWPFRVIVASSTKRSSAVCDQIRAISKERLRKKIGTLSSSEKESLLKVIRDIFSE